MERYVEKFPEMFEGFDPKSVIVFMTQKKKSKEVAKVRSLPYPLDAIAGKPYLMEFFDEIWQKLTPKQRNMVVFSAMCSIPHGGFDPASKYYAKQVKPDIKMHSLAYAAFGGVPNWLENDAAVDPLDRDEAAVVGEAKKLAGIKDDEGADDGVTRVPVTGVDDVDSGGLPTAVGQ
jgi:hypothetical protein